MSYDRLWIHRPDNPHHFLERRTAEKQGAVKSFDAEFNRLKKQGIFVVLRAGKNVCIDEIFVFEDLDAATYFFEQEYLRFEYDDDEETCGFDEVAIYCQNRCMATKSCGPRKTVEPPYFIDKWAHIWGGFED